MPRRDPPCDSIPWYITSFQSSPVRICAHTKVNENQNGFSKGQYRGTDLKHGEQGNGKTVEIRWWCAFWEVESTTKELHAQQGEYENKQEE